MYEHVYYRKKEIVYEHVYYRKKDTSTSTSIIVKKMYRARLLS